MVTVAVARAADTLTLARLALAVLLALVIAGDRLLLGAVILVSGWTTDTMDGILARRAPGMTRLGPWDATIDGMVGAGLMVGLVMGGYAPMAWLIDARRWTSPLMNSIVCACRPRRSARRTIRISSAAVCANAWSPPWPSPVARRC